MASASHTAFSRHTRGWMSIRSNAELVTSPSKLERYKGFLEPFEGRVWWWVSEKVQVLSESVFRRPSLDDEATFCPAHYRTKDGKRRESILPKRAIVGSRVSTSTNHEKCWRCSCTAKAGERNKMERLNDNQCKKTWGRKPLKKPHTSASWTISCNHKVSYILQGN